MSKKKNTVKKMKVEPTVGVIEKDYYVTLTKEQYETLSRIIRWDNPIEKIDDITGSGDLSNIEIGFNLGKLYSEFQETFSKLEDIINEIEPSTDTEEYDEEDSDNVYEYNED